MAYVSLHERLRGDIATQLKKQLDIDNVHALPRVTKVVVNVGINRTEMEGKEMQEYVIDSLKRITGQKPVLRASRKSISNFKITKGRIVGAVVTLRGKQMEAFIERLVNYVLPRIRDFRGIPSKFDGHGNYALGFTDHTVFPEIPTNEVQRSFGLQVQVTTNAGNDAAAKALLTLMGFPFRGAKVSQAEA